MSYLIFHVQKKHTFFEKNPDVRIFTLPIEEKVAQPN
jgi:hypothetical protein